MFSSQIQAGHPCGEYIASKKNQEDISAVQTRIKDGLDNADTYFSFACKTSVKGVKLDSETTKIIQKSMNERPQIYSLRTSIPFMDGGGNEAQDFFRKVRARIEEKRVFAKRFAEGLKQCTTNSSSASENPDCEGIRDWSREQLPQILNLARFNLAMALPSPEASSFSDSNEVSLNEQLSLEKSYKAIPWKPLDEKEKKNFSKSLEQLKTNVTVDAIADRTFTSRAERRNVFLNEMAQARHNHYLIYLSLMGLNPILQYFDNANPNAIEVKNASEKVLSNLEVEHSKLKKIDVAIENPFVVGRSGTKSFDESVLDLMDYRTEVEEVLLENPRFCGMGLAMNQVRGSRAAAKGVAMLPILAISFFVPVSYGIAMGLVMTGVAAHDSKSKLSASEAQEAARVQREGMKAFNENVILANKSTAEIRNEMANDVTEIYRANLQQVRKDEVDLSLTIGLGIAFSASPVAAKYLRYYRTNIKNTVSK